jgi:hypothetical protein
LETERGEGDHWKGKTLHSVGKKTMFSHVFEKSINKRRTERRFSGKWPNVNKGVAFQIVATMSNTYSRTNKCTNSFTEVRYKTENKVKNTVIKVEERVSLVEHK